MFKSLLIALVTLSIILTYTATAEKRLSTGTLFNVKLIQDISSKDYSEGDTVLAEVEESVSVGNQVFIEKGAPVTLSIGSAQDKGYAMQTGWITLNVRDVFTIDNKKIPAKGSYSKVGSGKFRGRDILKSMAIPFYTLKKGKSAIIKKGTIFQAETGQVILVH